jgi:hypothetical protein
MTRKCTEAAEEEPDRAVAGRVRADPADSFRFAVFVDQHGRDGAIEELLGGQGSWFDTPKDLLGFGRWLVELFDFAGAQAAFRRASAGEGPAALAAARELALLEASEADGSWLRG